MGARACLSRLLLGSVSPVMLAFPAAAEYVPLPQNQRVSGYQQQRQITCYQKIGGIIRAQARFTLQPSGDLVSHNDITLSRFERYRYPADSSGDTWMHKWIRPDVLRRYKFVGSTNKVIWSEDYDFSRQEVRDPGRGTVTCFTRPKPMGMPIDYVP